MFIFVLANVERALLLYWPALLVSYTVNKQWREGEGGAARLSHPRTQQ